MSDSFATLWTIAHQPPWISQARILEWDAISFFKESSWTRDQTHISCEAGGFFTTDPLEKNYLPEKLLFNRQNIQLHYCNVREAEFFLMKNDHKIQITLWS